MATISAKDVAALRAETGIGMMECKKALVEADGDKDKALKVLRERGLAVAAKKESRIAAEGVVDILKADGKTAIIEVNAETDFVAKNQIFKDFVKGVLATVIANNPADVDALKECKYNGEDMTVDAMLSEMRFKIGEKITIRRFALVDGITGAYVHHDSSTAVVVCLDAGKECAEVDECARKLALQVAGSTPAPKYVRREEIPADVFEEEKSIQIAAMKNDPKNAGKPDNILEKIVIGKMGKFYESVCLIDQEFLFGGDESQSVAKYVEGVAKAAGTTITVKSFILYNKGEGLEKREDNFAAEIAELTKKN